MCVIRSNVSASRCSALHPLSTHIPSPPSCNLENLPSPTTIHYKSSGRWRRNKNASGSCELLVFTMVYLFNLTVFVTLYRFCTFVQYRNVRLRYNLLTESVIYSTHVDWMILHFDHHKSFGQTAKTLGCQQEKRKEKSEKRQKLISLYPHFFPHTRWCGDRRQLSPIQTACGLVLYMHEADRKSQFGPWFYPTVSSHNLRIFFKSAALRLFPTFTSLYATLQLYTYNTFPHTPIISIIPLHTVLYRTVLYQHTILPSSIWTPARPETAHEESTIPANFQPYNTVSTLCSAPELVSNVNYIHACYDYRRSIPIASCPSFYRLVPFPPLVLFHPLFVFWCELWNPRSYNFQLISIPCVPRLFDPKSPCPT